MSQSERKPFTSRPSREDITREPDPAGRWSVQFPEMLGYRSQGGGKVPADFGWATNPKEWQEEHTEATLARRYQALRVPHGAEAAAPQLPEGDKKP